MVIRSGFLLLLLLITGQVFAQDLLTVEQAIAVSLKNNYDIQIAKNREEISSINNNIGNAGMLPRANITVTDNASLNNLNQKFSSGLLVDQKNVSGNNLNPALNISWTLFDGLKMFATKSKLKRLAEIGELNYKDTLQTIVAQTINAYYDVVSANQQLKALNEAIKISEERVKVAETRFRVGSSSKVDWLQAKVDLNEQKSGLLNQNKVIEQKKAELNRILARAAETEFITADSIPINYDTNLNSSNELESKNFQLLAASKNIEIARFSKKEVFAQFLPNLNVNGAYAFTRSQSSAGFSLYNQTYGLSGGFTLAVPLFNGLNTIHQYKIAGIQILNSQFALEKAKIQTKLNFYKVLRDFETTKEILKLEEDNIVLADENVKIALERFRLAQSTAIELREAQNSYEDARTRLVNARFNTKVAETELMRLQGALVK
ncbi:MAG: TolC family protein [Bacteroidetes bacterium]|nr:TolC family protein [Bacteroidota bacterium]